MDSDINIILASQSPRRREFLSKLVDKFEIIPSELPENARGDARRVALQQGYDKALDVFSRNPCALVIGADTIVVLDGQILGKPHDAGDARRMLKLLSGREHSVLTGMAVVSPKGCVARLDETRVKFFTLSDGAIDDYIATGEPMDKAGAYGIQGLGGAFVQSYAGDYENVCGLCVTSLARLLVQKFGVAVKPRA